MIPWHAKRCRCELCAAARLAAGVVEVVERAGGVGRVARAAREAVRELRPSGRARLPAVKAPAPPQAGEVVVAWRDTDERAVGEPLQVRPVRRR